MKKITMFILTIITIFTVGCAQKTDSATNTNYFADSVSENAVEVAIAEKEIADKNETVSDGNDHAKKTTITISMSDITSVSEADISDNKQTTVSKKDKKDETANIKNTNSVGVNNTSSNVTSGINISSKADTAAKVQSTSSSVNTSGATSSSSTSKGGHTHSWKETGRGEETIRCDENKKYVDIYYECSCGEKKTEKNVTSAGCVYGPVYSDWEYGFHFQSCERWRWEYGGCQTHNVKFSTPPVYRFEDTHHRVYNVTEPSCTEKGGIYVYCDKCDLHLKTEDQQLTNETYPDGGGNGHKFFAAQSGIEVEFNGDSGLFYTMCRMECSVCHFTYDDIENDGNLYYYENGQKIPF